MVLTWLTSFAFRGFHGIVSDGFPGLFPSDAWSRSSRLRWSFLITCSIVAGGC